MTPNSARRRRKGRHDESQVTSEGVGAGTSPNNRAKWWLHRGFHRGTEVLESDIVRLITPSMDAKKHAKNSEQSDDKTTCSEQAMAAAVLCVKTRKTPAEPLYDRKQVRQHQKPQQHFV